MPTYTAEAAYPYPARTEQASAALRGALRLKMPLTEAPDWSTFEMSGPAIEPDGHGRPWYAFTGTVRASDELRQGAAENL